MWSPGVTPNADPRFEPGRTWRSGMVEETRSTPRETALSTHHPDLSKKASNHRALGDFPALPSGNGTWEVLPHAHPTVPSRVGPSAPDEGGVGRRRPQAPRYYTDSIYPAAQQQEVAVRALPRVADPGSGAGSVDSTLPAGPHRARSSSALPGSSIGAMFAMSDIAIPR